MGFLSKVGWEGAYLSFTLPSLSLYPTVFATRTKVSALMELKSAGGKRQKLMKVDTQCGEGNGNPLQCSCLENPRDRGAWWAAVYGVAQSWTRLKQLSSSSGSSGNGESRAFYYGLILGTPAPQALAPQPPLGPRPASSEPVF